jgi:hypothetical protein
MCTFQYNIRESVVFKHVFTSNREELQVVSGQLWEAIQLEVELRKETSGTKSQCGPSTLQRLDLMFTGPYFVYRTDERRDPVPISQTKKFMDHILKYYAELEGARVVNLTALAWLTPGTKRVRIPPRIV